MGAQGIEKGSERALPSPTGTAGEGEAIPQRFDSLRWPLVFWHGVTCAGRCRDAC
jgi:hypothetical protein